MKHVTAQSILDNTKKINDKNSYIEIFKQQPAIDKVRHRQSNSVFVFDQVMADREPTKGLDWQKE